MSCALLQQYIYFCEIFQLSYCAMYLPFGASVVSSRFKPVLVVKTQVLFQKRKPFLYVLVQFNSGLLNSIQIYVRVPFLPTYNSTRFHRNPDCVIRTLHRATFIISKIVLYKFVVDLLQFRVNSFGGCFGSPYTTLSCIICDSLLPDSLFSFINRNPMLYNSICEIRFGFFTSLIIMRKDIVVHCRTFVIIISISTHVTVVHS